METKTIHEILIIVKIAYVKRLKYGLCAAAIYSQDINCIEYDFFQKYLVKNAPCNVYTITSRIFGREINASYMWNKNDCNSRIKWLDKHIAKTK